MGIFEKNGWRTLIRFCTGILFIVLCSIICIINNYNVQKLIEAGEKVSFYLDGKFLLFGLLASSGTFFFFLAYDIMQDSEKVFIKGLLIVIGWVPVVLGGAMLILTYIPWHFANDIIWVRAIYLCFLAAAILSFFGYRDLDDFEDRTVFHVFLPWINMAISYVGIVAIHFLFALLGMLCEKIGLGFLLQIPDWVWVAAIVIALFFSIRAFGSSHSDYSSRESTSDYRYNNNYLKEFSPNDIEKEIKRLLGYYGPSLEQFDSFGADGSYSAVLGNVLVTSSKLSIWGGEFCCKYKIRSYIAENEREILAQDIEEKAERVYNEYLDKIDKKIYDIINEYQVPTYFNVQVSIAFRCDDCSR